MATVSVRLGDGVGVAVAVGVGVGLGVGVAVAVGVEVGEGVAVGIDVDVGVGAAVAVGNGSGGGGIAGVGVGVGCGRASKVALTPAATVASMLGVVGVLTFDRALFTAASIVASIFGVGVGSDEVQPATLVNKIAMRGSNGHMRFMAYHLSV